MENIEEEITSGSWRITYFNDSGTNETANFNSYNFTFNGDGTLTAVNGSNTYSGTWSVTDSNSNDDSPDDLDFNIYFKLTNDFEDLNDDWDIISHTSSELKLNDVSGGNGGTDELTFVKN
ncbi:MAG: META domain-containing protein [Bacteroidetes bacterium]|nr:META domain-containing protein [Bacteroidota bacterium]